MNGDVQKYFESAPQRRRERLEVLHAMILELFPESVVDMGYKMPTYHVGEGWIAIVNQKQYVSLYTCGSHHIEEFKRKCPTINTGKGCIRFKDNDRLPLSAIQSVIRHAIEYPKSTT